MRKRRAQGQQAAASGAFSWVFLYAFRSPLWQGLDNLSRLPADHAGKALKWRAFQRLKCVDKRYLFRCHSASSFWRMTAPEYDLYLHSIIHISCLVSLRRKKYNKKARLNTIRELPFNVENRNKLLRLDILPVKKFFEKIEPHTKSWRI